MKFEAIGTTWEIDLDDKDIESKIRKKIDEFDKNYSRFRKDSLVTEMSKQKGNFLLPEDARLLIDSYKKISDLTDGAVTPFIGSVMEQAGYDADYSFKPKEVNRPLKWDEAIEYKFPNLEILKPTMMDFGAGGKGYLIDIIADFLVQNGIKDFMINAGGDILYRNQNKKLRVGLEDPQNFSLAIGVAEILNQSICGSAGNRRAWDKFHHIIDPNKLESPKNILATWVISSTTLIADLLSTALFFVEGRELEKEYDMEYLVLYSDYSIRKSHDFPGEIFE